jgi:peptidoglycan/LPS O-acetylase OafA/YrhL
MDALPAARSATPRFDTIDVLRGLSILAVVLLHTWIRFYFASLDASVGMPQWLSHILFRQGGNGVTVFFAISGFLITTTSLRRFGSLANMRPAIFYRIRFARIGPPLFLLIAILSTLAIAGVEGFVVKHGTLHGAVLSALTFTLNHYEAVNGYLPANWDVLWSLSIEETFYLFFPLTCILFLQRKAGLWLWITLLTTFIILGPFGRTIWAHTDIAAEKSYLGGMSPIALGCLTALLTAHLQKRLPRRRILYVVEALGIFLLVWMVAWPRWHWLHPLMHRIGISGVDDTLLALGTCLVMLASVLLHQKGSHFTTPIRWFGRHSYEIYLTHEFLVILGVELYLKLNAQHHAGPLPLWFIGILLLTAPLGWLVARFFSEPLNRALRPQRTP